MTHKDLPSVDALDEKVSQVFAGRVVRKDLVRQVKVGANVPVYVLEFLLGQYCATDDPVAIEAGLRLVNTTLAEQFVRPDEANKVQAMVKEKGRHRIIDKVKVRLLETEDKYWAELVNFNHRYVHIPERYVRKYERLLEGGVWAEVELEYYPEEQRGGVIRPFFIRELKPIQLASFDPQDYRHRRAEFTTEEWMDLLIRSVGLEPQGMDWRLKMHILTRLAPMVERNVNIVELGPRGTGKSFVYREVSPYAILISGGKTTVANLFYNMATHRMGLVGLWDVVSFDEVAGIKFNDTTALQIMKDYMESGSFSRGREELMAEAGIVFLGNINVPMEVLLRTGHLFQPFPEEMQDMALIDRIHHYIPGWEVPKFQPEIFTSHYGFVVDYLAEAMHNLRRFNYTDVVNRYFSFGNHLNARDVKAVRKMVSAYLKLLHPHEEFTREELEQYVRFAMEGRRRVKEQLKRMGAFEYFQTSFSYIDNETREEIFVGVPEQTGEGLISSDPLEPGVVYTAAVTDGEKVALHRVEVTRMPGTGKLFVTGTHDRAMKESIVTAFHYIRAHKRDLGIERDIDSYDFHVQVVDLMSHKEGSEAGVSFFVAMYSLLKNKSVLPGLVVLGEMTIQGNILPVRTLSEPLQVAMENGARRVLLPMASARFLPQVPPDVLEKVDPIFYNDPFTAAVKALGV